MDLNKLISIIEECTGQDLKFSVKEFHHLQKIREDVLYLERLLNQAKEDRSAIIDYYEKRLKREQKIIEKTEKRLEGWISRLEGLLLKEESSLSPEARRYIEEFLSNLEKSKKNVVRILSHNGELHQLLKKSPPDWNEIERKIDEALGDEKKPGIRMLIQLFQQLEHVEKRIEEEDIINAIDSLRGKISKRGIPSIFDLKDDEALDRLLQIKKRREQSAVKPASEKVAYFCILIAQKLGLPLKESGIPIVVLDPDLESNAAYNGQVILCSNPELFLRSGETMGEEIGHFFRDKLSPEEPFKEELITHEFFGFLGRRILFSVLSDLPSREIKEIFYGEPTFAMSRKMIVDRRKKLKKWDEMVEERIKDSKAFKQGDEEEVERLRNYFERLFHSEAKLLRSEAIHYRGYKYASQLDLSKIKNWKKLFSMPDREVRMRFFRPDPDYSGLD